MGINLKNIKAKLAPCMYSRFIKIYCIQKKIQPTPPLFMFSLYLTKKSIHAIYKNIIPFFTFSQHKWKWQKMVNMFGMLSASWSLHYFHPISISSLVKSKKADRGKKCIVFFKKCCVCGADNVLALFLVWYGKSSLMATLLFTTPFQTQLKKEGGR